MPTVSRPPRPATSRWKRKPATCPRARRSSRGSRPATPVRPARSGSSPRSMAVLSRRADSPGRLRLVREFRDAPARPGAAQAWRSARSGFDQGRRRGRERRAGSRRQASGSQTKPAEPLPGRAPGIAIARAPARATLPRLGTAEVAVIDELDKVHPVTGAFIPPQPDRLPAVQPPLERGRSRPGSRCTRPATSSWPSRC